MGVSVLLVEDEPGIQLAIRGLLRREGYETAVAANTIGDTESALLLPWAGFAGSVSTTAAFLISISSLATAEMLRGVG